MQTILGRINSAFNKIETGMVASGHSIETRGRGEGVQFDEYREQFRTQDEASTALVFAEGAKDIETEANVGTFLN